MSDGPLATVGKSVTELLMQLLATIGLALGGGQAAAASELAILEQESWREHHDRVLSPADLAAAVIKGHIEAGEAADEAQASGYDGRRFGIMVDTTGNPPGPMELLEMLRRGVITEGDFEKGVRQGYLRNEWVTPYLQLRYDLPTISELVEGVVQSHIDEGAASDLADRQGTRRDMFDLYVQNAGNPPGPETLLTMWNRGLLDQATVEQGLRESRLKNKYIPAFLGLARRRIPLRSATSAIGHGVLTGDQAVQYLKALGYTDEDARILIAAAAHAETSPHKEASLTTIRSLYVDHIIDKATATADLTRIGYDPNTADLILTLAERESLHRLQQAAVNKVHSIYVAHHMADDVARSDLATLGVDSEQVDYMLQLWALERDANVHALTPAQIVSAGKKGIIDGNEVVARLVQSGYSTDDATILAMEGGAIALPASGGANA